MVWYPHTLIATLQSDEATKDESGNWQAGSSSTISQVGRYEPTSGNGTVRAADGTQLDYSGIFYMPQNAATIPFGALVQIVPTESILVSSQPAFIPANELVEITVDTDNGNVVNDERLVGKRYSLERRGIGRLKANEFGFTDTGFAMEDEDDTVDLGEVFFANVFAIESDSVTSNTGDVIVVDTVKRFFRGQINARLWL